MRFLSTRIGRSTIIAFPDIMLSQSVFKNMLQISATTRSAQSARRKVSGFRYRIVPYSTPPSIAFSVNPGKNCPCRLYDIFDQVQDSAIDRSSHRTEEVVDKLVDHTAESDFQIRTSLNREVSQNNGDSHQHGGSRECFHVFQFLKGCLITYCKFFS